MRKATILLLSALFALLAPAGAAQAADRVAEAKAQVRAAYDAAKAVSVDRGGRIITRSFGVRKLARAIARAEPRVRPVRVARRLRGVCRSAGVYLVRRGTGPRRIRIAKRVGPRLVVLRAGGSHPRVKVRRDVRPRCGR